MKDRNDVTSEYEAYPFQPRSQALSSCGAKTLVDAGHVIC
jgi:hypothetical protein